MKYVAIIMAGGKGERFWPKSRKKCPKQFLSLTGDGNTMIQLTIERMMPLIDIKDIYVVTNADYIHLVREQIPLLPEENILAEPMAKNTAPCIGFAAAHISNKYGDAVMVVIPSDHLIKHKDIYLAIVKQGIQLAEQDHKIVTIGVTPTCPETGYGYIKYEINGDEQYNAYRVNKFVEKPDQVTAKEYLKDGSYLWNSGIFIFSTSTILSCFKALLPQIYTGIINIQNATGTNEQHNVIEREYEKFLPESFDVGIMEKANDIYVLPGSFGWDDVGSWTAIERFNSLNECGNIVHGNCISVDVQGSIVQAEDKLIAMVGVEDLVVVDTPDAILICAKDKTQHIKKIVETLKNCNMDEYL